MVTEAPVPSSSSFDLTLETDTNTDEGGIRSLETKPPPLMPICKVLTRTTSVTERIGLLLRRTFTNESTLSTLSTQSTQSLSELLSSIRSAGVLTFTIDELCDCIADSSSASSTFIESITLRKENSGVKHEFLIFYIKRRFKREIWMRLERKAAEPSSTRFLAGSFESEAEDCVRPLNHHM